MSFQILNSQNEPIDINQLDEEAALFWDKKPRENQYASPSPLFTNDANLQGGDLISAMVRYEFNSGNWFDVIGHSIDNQGSQYSGWTNVVVTMIAESIGLLFIDTSKGYDKRSVQIDKIGYNEETEEITGSSLLAVRIEATLSYYEPYIALINHWKSKGYKPKKIS